MPMKCHLPLQIAVLLLEAKWKTIGSLSWLLKLSIAHRSPAKNVDLLYLEGVVEIMLAQMFNSHIFFMECGDDNRNTNAKYYLISCCKTNLFVLVNVLRTTGELLVAKTTNLGSR